MKYSRRVTPAELASMPPNARLAIESIRLGGAVFPAGDSKAPSMLCPRRPAAKDYAVTHDGARVALTDIPPVWMPIALYPQGHAHAGEWPGGCRVATTSEELARRLYWDRPTPEEDEDAAQAGEPAPRWSSQPPGLVLPPGVIAVDIDHAHLVPAALLADLRAASAQIVSTPSGGEHLYFSAPDPDEYPWATLQGGLNIDTPNPDKPGRRYRAGDWKCCGKGFVFAAGVRRNGGQYRLVKGATFHLDPDRLTPLPPDAVEAVGILHRRSEFLSRTWVSGWDGTERAPERVRTPRAVRPAGDRGKGPCTTPKPAQANVAVPERLVGLCRGGTMMERAVTIADLATMIRDGTLAAETDAYRALPAEEQKRQKFKRLLSVMVAGPWEKSRKMALPDPFTCLWQIDLDKNIGDGAAIRSAAAAHPSTVLFYRTAGGEGYCAVVRGADDADVLRYRTWRRVIIEHLGWERWSDPSASEKVNGVRFVVHDPDAVYRPDAVPLDVALPAGALPDRRRADDGPGGRFRLRGTVNVGIARDETTPLRYSPAALRTALACFDNGFRGQGGDSGMWDAVVAVRRGVEAGHVTRAVALRELRRWNRGGKYPDSEVEDEYDAVPPFRGAGDVPGTRILDCVIRARKRTGR